MTVVQDDLAPAVANAFAAALSRLSAAGATIIEVPMNEFARASEVNPRGAISSYESFSFHKEWIREAADKYDPRVLARIRPGEAISEKKYNEVLQARDGFVRAIDAAASGYDAMLMPTTPDTAPTIAEATKDDESYFRLNNRMLRNPSLVNLFDGCALSIPCHEPGNAPVGLMIAGTQMTDRSILAIGDAVEKIVRQNVV
jgi:aspartyl-tRNA(Asn)/glutamyl-tRNA(Gln) amidotransferase subunit A